MEATIQQAVGLSFTDRIAYSAQRTGCHCLTPPTRYRPHLMPNNGRIEMSREAFETRLTTKATQPCAGR